VKTLGLIGGVSWHSTLDYYRLINMAVEERLGPGHSARLVLYNVDLAEIRSLHARGDREGAARVLEEAARSLAAAGAEMGLICANTLHMYFDRVASAGGIPFIHIADAAAERLLADGVRVVGLLGTKATMEAGFYRERLARHGVEVVVPGPREREEVDGIIFRELVRGVFSEEARERVAEIARGLADRGAQGVLLACTELPLLMRGVDVGVPLYDTVELHVEKAVELAFRQGVEE